jgi:hypothetical protein
MLARCPTHGRVYDKDAEPGCPLCLQGVPAAGAAPSPPRASRRTLAMAAGAGVLVGVAAFFVWRALRPAPAPAAPTPAAVDTLALLDEGEAFAEPDDPRPIRQARAYLAALERVYLDRAALLRFAEGPADTAAAPAARRRASQYTAFATRWRSALEGAKPDSQLFYRPGVRWAEQLESVNNYLGAARSAMREAAPPDRVLPRTERQRRLAAARGYLNSAGTALSELPAAGAGTGRRPRSRSRALSGARPARSGLARA